MDIVKLNPQTFPILDSVDSAFYNIVAQSGNNYCRCRGKYKVCLSMSGDLLDGILFKKENVPTKLTINYLSRDHQQRVSHNFTIDSSELSQCGDDYVLWQQMVPIFGLHFYHISIETVQSVDIIPVYGFLKCETIDDILGGKLFLKDQKFKVEKSAFNQSRFIYIPI